jgi:CRISPR-associated protein Csx10
MPLSVFGCKHFGSRDPAALTNPVKRKDQHGFDDFLYPPVPPICKEPDCGSPSDHKAGFCYLHPRFGYCDADVSRSIIPHNEFAENPKDKNVYFYEALAEGQLFYGEIAFSSQSHCELMDRLLRANPHARMGKAKYRGHGNVLFHTPIQRDQSLLNDWKLKGWRGPGPCFSIYLFSDAILVDESLNYRTGLDEKDLARWLKLPNTEGFRVHIRLGQQSHLKSFFKTGTTMGFNQHRGMPLPMEVVVTRGSVFTATYEGDIDIRGALESLEREGIGLRRNEGYGRILIDHAIHGQPREVSS